MPAASSFRCSNSAPRVTVAELTSCSLLPQGSAVNRHHPPLPFGSYASGVARKKLPTTFTGFAVRLQEALEARQAEDAKLFSIRYVEREAGLSSGQWQKWQKGIRGKGVRVDTIKGLARALRVNQEWLEGEGGPRDLTAESAVARATRRATRDGVRQGVIDAVLGLPHADTNDEETLFRLMTMGEQLAGGGSIKRAPRKRNKRGEEAPVSQGVSSRRKLAVSDD